MFFGKNLQRFTHLFIVLGCLSVPSSPSFASAKKPIRFVIVESGKIGDATCIKPVNPCFVPKNNGKDVFTVKDYTAKSISTNPRAVSVVPSKTEAIGLAKLFNAHMNEQAAIIVDEKLVQAPLIRTTVDTTGLEISTSTPEDCRELKTALGILDKE